MTKQNLEPITISPKRYMEQIDRGFRTKTPVYVFGQPGEGKSYIPQEYATNHGMAFIDFRLSQKDPTQIAGIPAPCDRGGVMSTTFLVPEDLPRDLDYYFTIDVDAIETRVPFYNPKSQTNKIHYCTNPKVHLDVIGSHKTGHRAEMVGEQGLDNFTVVVKDKNGELTSGKVRVHVEGKVRAIFAFEEFNSAPPIVQAACYSVLLDRYLGGWNVPDGVLIMGMGNRQTDRGVVYNMPSPIIGRINQFTLKNNADEWIEWGFANGIEPSILGYISAFKNKLDTFDAHDYQHGYGSPRTWTAFSRWLTANKDADETMIRLNACGHVGPSEGLSFARIYEQSVKLPDINDVLNGKIKEIDSKLDIALMHGLAISACYELYKEAEKTYPKDKRTGGKKSEAYFNENAEYRETCKKVETFLEFCQNNFIDEIQVVTMQLMVRVNGTGLPLIPKREFMPVFAKMLNHFSNKMFDNNR